MEVKMTVRGIDPDDSTKTVAITTISGLDEGVIVQDDHLETAVINSILKKLQPIISTQIKSVSFSLSLTDSEEEETFDNLPTPGDRLNSDEIFTEDFSDIAVVPTLQLQNTTEAEGKVVVGASIKYMADPVDTADFESKVQSFAGVMAQYKATSQYWTNANLTLSAKDEGIVKPD